MQHTGLACCNVHTPVYGGQLRVAVVHMCGRRINAVGCWVVAGPCCKMGHAPTGERAATVVRPPGLPGLHLSKPATDLIYTGPYGIFTYNCVLCQG
jgi:hypothetical protein